MIDQLINEISAKLGIEPALARQGVGVVLGLLQKQGDSGPVSSLLAAVPGAGELASEYQGVGGGNTGLGGILGKIGGMLGGDTGDTLAAMAAFKETGLSTEQAGEFMPLVMDFFRDQAGEDVMKQALGSVPALEGFVN